MKILIIRFSSIGDIVMTTPVVRCLKKQLAAEVHFVTKFAFRDLLSHNPYLDKLVLFDQDWSKLMKELQAESYDLIVDLHNNIRSRRICAGLRQKSVRINKLSSRKQLLIYTGINTLPDLHVSERGLETVRNLGVKNDQDGMDYFFPAQVKFDQPFTSKQYVALALATTHFTKNMPYDLLEYIIKHCPLPMVFLGGPKEKDLGSRLASMDPSRLCNMAGNCGLQESALYVKNADFVIAGDTGMLHIAAALKKPTISVWGATIPEYGVFPYYGKHEIPHYIHEVILSCRPCSKHGSAKCPKKHFNCMRLHERESIVKHMELLSTNGLTM